MKSSAVLNSRHERTAGSTSHFGSSKAVSGSSAILFGGLSCVAMATPPPDTANRTDLHAASQHDQTASDTIGCAAPAVDQSVPRRRVYVRDGWSEPAE